MTHTSPLSRVAVVALGSLLASCAANHAHDKKLEKKPEAKVDLSEKPLAPLGDYVGKWTIDATWKSGETLSAVNVFKPIMDGTFIYADTYVSDNGGPMYQRYTTVFAWDQGSERIVAHGFNADGSVTEVAMTVEPTDPPTITSQWTVGESNQGVDIKQSIQTIDGSSYGWKVWTSPAALQEWDQIMDGVWTRVN